MHEMADVKMQLAGKITIQPTQFNTKTRFMNPSNNQPEDEVICPCSGTTRNQIQNLFEQGMDLDAISRWTGAVSGCGGCEWDISELLQQLSEQKNIQA